MPTTSSSRNHAGVRSAAAGMPGQHAPGRRLASHAARCPATLRPTASMRDVHAAEQVRRRRAPARAGSAPVERRTPPQHLAGLRRPRWRRTPGPARPGCAVLGDDGDLGRPGVSWRSASVANSPTAPAPTTSTRSPSRHLRPAGRLHRARQRLDQDGALVGRPSGTACSWVRWATSCSPQPPPVSAQKPVCSPGETWPTVIRSQRLVRPARAARRRAPPRAPRRPAPGRARPGCRRQVLAVVEQLADHLVAGNERHRDERGEVQRRRARDSVPRSEPQMPDSRGRTRAQPGTPDHAARRGHQPQRRHRAGEQPGHPAADRLGGDVARHRAEHLQGEHHRAPPLSCRAGRRAPGRARCSDGVRHVSTGQRAGRAPPRQSGTSGDDRRRAGRRPAASAGRSGCRRRRRTRDRSQPPSCGVAPQPRRPRLPDERRRGEEAGGSRRRSSTARSAATISSNSGASGRVSGRTAPVMQHRAVARRRGARGPGGRRPPTAGSSTWLGDVPRRRGGRARRRSAPSYRR